MIKSTGYFLVLSFAAISAAIAYPCQAETTQSQINATEANNITATKSPDIANTPASDRTKNLNTSKFFTISETNTIPTSSNSLLATPQNQSVRSNPLGCTFFNTPSMRQ